MRWHLLVLSLFFPHEAFAEATVADEILFRSSCGIAIKAALARGNSEDKIFGADEKEVAYAFILGLGANDPRPGNEEEVFGRGIGASFFFCERNPDVAIFEIGRIVGRE